MKTIDSTPLDKADKADKADTAGGALDTMVETMVGTMVEEI